MYTCLCTGSTHTHKNRNSWTSTLDTNSPFRHTNLRNNPTDSQSTQHNRTSVLYQLPQRHEAAVDALYLARALQASVCLVKKAVVPLHPVPRLPLLHDLQASLGMTGYDASSTLQFIARRTINIKAKPT